MCLQPGREHPPVRRRDERRRCEELDERVELGQLEQLHERDELDEHRQHVIFDELDDERIGADLVQHGTQRQALRNLVQLPSGRAVRQEHNRARAELPVQVADADPTR